MNKILIIYPNDYSTHFLLIPFNTLKNKWSDINFFEVYPNLESHNDCKNLINHNELIIFMGHGSHTKLSGAKDETFTSDLLTLAELKEMKKKSWLLFSCNSNDFLKSINNFIINGIGFGDLPTDINDIIGIREYNMDAYKGIEEEDINNFKKIINNTIIDSINYMIEKELGFHEYICFLKNYITSKYVNLLKIKPLNVRNKMLADLLFLMKEDIYFK